MEQNRIESDGNCQLVWEGSALEVQSVTKDSSYSQRHAVKSLQSYSRSANVLNVITKSPQNAVHFHIPRSTRNKTMRVMTKNKILVRWPASPVLNFT